MASIWRTVQLTTKIQWRTHWLETWGWEENRNEMTEAEIVEDFKQYLYSEEFQEIEAFDTWLKKNADK